MRRVLDWLDERTGWRGAVRFALDEPVLGGSSYVYVFGSVLTFILLLQAVTGIFLAMYYSPSASDAWASVAFIEDQVTAGWFIRGLHHHGASAMVIVAGLHMLQTAIYGAYKKPREVNWIVGVLMLGLILAFALTGYLLPWDQTGYWATKVATGIAGATPLVGEQMQQAAQAGNEYGNLTLTRFYAIHVLVLPGAIFGLVALHLALFRKHGATPKWGRSDADLVKRQHPFWPDQLFKDMVAIAVTFGVLVAVVISTGGAGLDAPADPSSNFDARPEWYFRSMYQAIKYFEGGPLALVVELGLPILIGGVLIGLPFVDRGPDRDPKRRIAYLSVLGVGFAAVVGLTLESYRVDANDAKLQERIVEADKQADRARFLAREYGVPPGGGIAVFTMDPDFRREQLWVQECAACHEGDDRKGPLIGPGYNSRAWIREFLQNPSGELFFGTTQIDDMKPVKETGEDLDALVELVYAQTGATDADPALVERGTELFDDGNCWNCHALDWETEGDTGPNLARRGSVDMLAAFIADPDHQRWFGDKNEMPGFGDKLSDDEIRQLAEWIASLRKNPWEPGGSPKPSAPGE